jgi:hypothetical protein
MAQVVVELAGVGSRRCGDQQRTAVTELGERGDRDRSGDSGTATRAAGLPNACVNPASSRSSRGSVASEAADVDDVDDMRTVQGTADRPGASGAVE